MAVTARGLAKAAEILAGQFTLVGTNMPFLGRGKQDVVLQDYCQRVHPDAKADLATCFVERCLEFCVIGGSTAFVTPQNWLFLATYQSLRKQLLVNSKIQFVAELGAGAFQTPLYDFSFALFVANNVSPPAEFNYTALIASGSRAFETKVKALINSACLEISQKTVIAQSDCRILTTPPVENAKPLSVVATPNTGLQTGDNDHYTCLFWEQPSLLNGWEFFHRTSQETLPFGGRCRILLWEDGRGALVSEDGCAIRGLDCRGKRGVLVHRMGDLPVTLFTGEMFDQNGAALIPFNEVNLPAVWCFLASEDYKVEVRKLDNKVGVTPATLAKVPFDLAHWQNVAAGKFPDGLPKPFSSDATQWLFDGHPCKADNPLQVAVARLLCYQWPRQTGSSFPDCPAVGPDGLEKYSDDDGIVALSSVNREEAAAPRVRALLRHAYGADWKEGVTERQMLADAGYADSTLEEWLRDSFFEEHCKLFYHRPFVWHIWDGERDGFHALINYHRLSAPNGEGARLLQKLAQTYLGDWIARCEADVKNEKPNAHKLLKAAKDLQVDLLKILEGEAPNDIFVRWKTLHEQAIGWNPDINDGVRLNIRPFLTVRDVGKKGAGLLRFKPNIKWDKDRGSEPKRPKAEFPWFWSCMPEDKPEHFTDFFGGSEFTGERWNNLHYTLAAKKAARSKFTPKK
jgi:hypothetical protein